MATTNNPLPEPPILEGEVAATAATLQPPPREPVWNGWDVALLVVAFVVAFFTATFVGTVILSLLGFSAAPHSALATKVILVAQLFAYLIMLAAMWALMTRFYRRRFGEAVSWRWPSAAEAGVYLAAGVLTQYGVQFSLKFLPVPRSLPIERFFQDMTSAYLMLLIGVTMAPLMEELFFRGFFYPAVARRLGKIAGIAITAATFALLHAQQVAGAWAPLLILFGVGLLLTILRVLTKSVAASFIFHVGYNASLFAAVYILTDRFRHLERLIQR